ncbi:MAG: PIN domain-containing protein [Burkholderiales bacterium]|nr:PIN domain-containing protein [Burkholderiales bacterium]
MSSIASPADAVLDTNVVLDWLVFREPSIAPLVQCLESGRLRWVGTPPMLDELACVLARPGLERWADRLSWANAMAVRLCHRVQAQPVAAARSLWCTDADDQMFIDLALGRSIPWLVSRDRALLRLARRAKRLGVTVLRPDAWPVTGWNPIGGERSAPE